jgi:hypothetical protein
MTDFKKRIYSGTCLCGHSYEDHHLGMVLNPEAHAVMGPYLPEECEFFGSNEDGGLDEQGQDHCWRYVDSEEPDPELRAGWKGTSR